MPAQVAPPPPPPAQPPPAPPPPGGTGKPTDVGPPAPAKETAPKPPVSTSPGLESNVTTPSESKGGGGFVLGLFIGLVVAVLAGTGVYLWQQDVEKKEVEDANARVTACNEEIGKSLSAAVVWKDQFVKLSQSVNSSEWIAEHCAAVESGAETEATETSP